MGMLLSSIPATTAMVALALGYIVLVLAKKESGRLKSAGYMIGIVIIIASSLLILTKLAWISASSNSRCYMPKMQYRIMQERQIPTERPLPIPKK